MGCRQTIFKALRTAKTPAADQALSAALARVNGQTARATVETLLARQTREGLGGLVYCWHQLDEPLCDLVLARADQIFPVLREAFGAFDEQIRLNVIDIIQRGRLCRASYLLDSGLRDRGTDVRTAAARAMLAMTEELLRCAPAFPLPAGVQPHPSDLRQHMVELDNYQEDRRQIAATVDSALNSFDLHEHPCVVEAAMWLADDLGSRLWKALLLPGNRLTRVALGILERGQDTRLIPFMLHALGYAEFRPVVAHLLAACNEPAFLEQWLRESWRLVEPKTARAMAVLRDLACIRNQLLDILCLPEEAQRHFPRCVLATGMAESMKIEVLKEMHRRGQSLGRRAALWALAGLHEPQCTSLLRSIAAEGDPEYSGIARRELTHRRPKDYPLDGLVSGSAVTAPHDAADPERMTSAAYWLAFDRLSDAERKRLGKELLADDRLTRDKIAGWLDSTEPSDRVRALRMIGLLDLAADFEHHLYRICHDPHCEVRSAAVAVLGKLPTPTSRRVLQNALYDPDPRVQANTVEALEQIGLESVTAEMIEKLDSSDNRTRANAVRALLKLGVREAANTLLLMLRDDNRAHRASALWLVEHLQLSPLAARVLEMSKSEQDEQLRDRALSLVGKMASYPEPKTEPPAGKDLPK